MLIPDTRSWENSLLALAAQAEQSPVAAPPFPDWDEPLLNQAYAYCDWVTATHSKTFATATRLLPAKKRRAVRALYAFCRTSDDLVDGSDLFAEEALAHWREKVALPLPPLDDLVLVAWADTRYRYKIPLRYAEQLLTSLASDLHSIRYETFADLVRYAYGVASTVGLMSMHIIGSQNQQSFTYAVKLGIALQMTNILRDVGEDRQMGRLYLPTEELAAYGLTEEDLDRGQIDDRWRAFMRFQIERNRRLYAEAEPGIALLHKDGRLAIAAASHLYSAILSDIEAHDYDVFHRRAHVGNWNKLLMLPLIWWHAHMRGGHDEAL